MWKLNVLMKYATLRRNYLNSLKSSYGKERCFARLLLQILQFVEGRRKEKRREEMSRTNRVLLFNLTFTTDDGCFVFLFLFSYFFLRNLYLFLIHVYNVREKPAQFRPYKAQRNDCAPLFTWLDRSCILRVVTARVRTVSSPFKDIQ